MPKALKEELADEINAAATELGLGDGFIDRIADETVAEEEEQLAEWLAERGHPAVEMEAMF